MEKRNQLNEMKSLIDRMNNPRTGWGTLLNENAIEEVSTKWRQVVGPEEFYDILTGVPQARKVTFGYVTAAKIEVPKGKRLNPATNRMNQFDDYGALGQNLGVEGTLTGVIKLAIYNMSWQTEDSVNKAYGDWKSTRDELGAKYGVEFGKAKYQTNKMEFGNNGGVSAYNGDNQENIGHTYTNLNMNGIYPLDTSYYLVMEDGSLQPIDASKLTMLASKSKESTIDKLMAAGATEEEVASLKTMNYQRFEHSHLLFFSANPTEGNNAGIPSLFINTQLSAKIGNFTAASTEQIINLAKERYTKFTGFKTDATQTAGLNSTI